jgi:hypothetical protein
MIAVLTGVSAALTSVRGAWAEEVFAAAWQRLALERASFGGKAGPFNGASGGKRGIGIPRLRTRARGSSNLRETPRRGVGCGTADEGAR